MGRQYVGADTLCVLLYRNGIAARSRYFSIRFAELVGWSFYSAIANGTEPAMQELAGEWIFNRALFDVTPEELARLHGPVGVFIGSKTPPEIAVSVLAEVLAAKNGVPVPHDMQVAPAKDQLARAMFGVRGCGGTANVERSPREGRQ